MSQHPAAVAAVAEPRRLGAAGTTEVEPPERVRPANRAVSGFGIEKARAGIAGMLLEALIVARLAPVFVHDADPGRQRVSATRDAIARATLTEFPGVVEERMDLKAVIRLACFVLAGSVASGGAIAAPPAGCPTEDEVRAAVERYILEDWWTPSQRETWQIADVGEFAFGPIRYGNPKYSQCPLRMEYSFKVWHRDGRIEETRKGVGETFSFFKNDFDEWRFTVGAS